MANRLLTLAIAQALACSAQAVTITVDDASDNGAGCTLRKAIEAAKGTPALPCITGNAINADTIDFDLPALSTITLASALPTIEAPISIIGPGADALTINLAGATAGLSVDVSLNLPTSAEISGLSLTGAGNIITPLRVDGSGPADSAVVLNDLSFDNNGSSIGAIRMSDVDVNVSSVTVTGNTASSHGAILLERSLAQLDTILVQNNNGVNSGGLRLYRSTATVTNASFDLNYASNNAAVTVGSMSELTINDSSITNNNGNSTFNGSGLSISGGTLSADNLTVAGNLNGGVRGRSGANVSISNSLVDDNYAERGAGVLINDADLYLFNSQISNNRALNSGAGINVYEGPSAPFMRSIRLVEVTIAGNEAYGAFGGSGMVVDRAAAEVVDSLVTGNGINAYTGGVSGIRTTRADITVSGSRITNNAGGLRADLGTVTLDDVTIADNFLYATDGVAASFRYASQFNITNSRFERNLGRSALSANGSSGGSILDTSFRGNASIYQGGAVSFSSTDTLSIARSVFEANTAGSFGGGAIYANNGTLAIENTTFGDNVANRNNSNHLSIGTNTDLHHVTLLDRSPVSYGGAIEVTDGATLSVFNTVASVPGTVCTISNGAVNLTGSNVISDGSCGAAITDDPQLATLADNGGATLSFFPLAGGPLVDGGGAGCPAEDQRGFPRSDGLCDIGAVETQSDSQPPMIADQRFVLLTPFIDDQVIGTIEATGAEPTDLLTLELVNNPDGLLVVAADGTLEVDQDSFPVGTYSAQVEATSDAGLSNRAAIAVSIEAPVSPRVLDWQFEAPASATTPLSLGRILVGDSNGDFPTSDGLQIVPPNLFFRINSDHTLELTRPLPSNAVQTVALDVRAEDETGRIGFGVIEVTVNDLLFGNSFEAPDAGAVYVLEAPTYSVVLPVEGTPYTVSDRITGRFALPQPLQPNRTYDLSDVLTQFQFSDGLQSLSDTNAELCQFDISTGPTGAIVDWSILIRDALVAPGERVQTLDLFGSFAQAGFSPVGTPSSCGNIALAFSANTNLPLDAWRLVRD